MALKGEYYVVVSRGEYGPPSAHIFEDYNRAAEFNDQSIREGRKGVEILTAYPGPRRAPRRNEMREG